MTTSAAGFDLAQTDKLLTTTRSVRKRLDFSRPVSRDVVLECIDIALQAPSGGNSQPWRWLVVDDPAVIQPLGAIYRKAHDPYMAANRKAAEEAGVTDRNAIMDSSSYLSEHMGEVPVMVIPTLLGRVDGASGTDSAGFFGSILPAAWSLMLALRSRGLGSAWTTLHLVYEKEAAEVLGIPDTVTQCALLPVAYYTGDDFKPAKRQPATKVTYFNGWKQR
ncbi:MAG TPA: nitroreductase family protein [Acidimicrobiales bacterium]|nr:nitroreductase family protein [Acidimicrobiales bacterium]